MFIFGIQLRFNYHLEHAWVNSTYSNELMKLRYTCKCQLSWRIPHRCDSVSMTKWPQGGQKGSLCNDTWLQWGAKVSPPRNCKPCHLITNNGARTKRSDWTDVICCCRRFVYTSSPVAKFSPEVFAVSHVLSECVKSCKKAGQEKYEGGHKCFSP